jgi:hypothetical protein
MATKIEAEDILVEEKPRLVKEFSSETGYPFGLDENQVCRLIYFFGARKLSAKSMVKKGKTGGATTRPADFTSQERMFLIDAFPWFGIVYFNPTQFSAGYRSVITKFKRIMDFLRQRPAFITTDITEALKTAGYRSALKNIVMVMNENREMVPRIITTKDASKPIPLGKIETDMWEFQNVLSDKMMLIIRSIKPEDIAKANLGIKSKALRDLYSVMHMARLANNKPNPTLIGINIQTSSVGDKLKAVTAYAVKNRETRQ